MKGQTRLRKAIDKFATESIKENLLNKIPQELKDRLYAEGGDIEVDIDKNSYTIGGCSKVVSDEIALFLIQRKKS